MVAWPSWWLLSLRRQRRRTESISPSGPVPNIRTPRRLTWPQHTLNDTLGGIPCVCCSLQSCRVMRVACPQVLGCLEHHMRMAMILTTAPFILEVFIALGLPCCACILEATYPLVYTTVLFVMQRAVGECTVGTKVCPLCSPIFSSQM
jgi:hypothetical protein